VEYGKDDVDGAENPSSLAGLDVDQATAGGVTGQDHGLALGHLGQLAVVDLQGPGVVAGQHPAALAGDPDRHHVVAVAVQRPENAARADTGDGVLGAAAAEDDGHPESSLHVGHSAQRTRATPPPSATLPRAASSGKALLSAP